MHSKIRGKKADCIIIDDLSDYPEVRHDDLVDAVKYMTFDLETTAAGSVSGGPATQQVPRGNWPAYWTYSGCIGVWDNIFKEDKRVHFTVDEDGETTISCVSYTHTFKQKGYIPPKYETAVLMLDAGLEDDMVIIPGLGELRVTPDFFGKVKRRYYFEF